MGEREIVRTTCPRDCYDSCGIAVVKRDSVIAKVLGDPDHPVSRGGLCGKCAIAYNGVWRDSEARLTRPLRRIGAKGEGRFEPLAWDAALAIVAEHLTAIVEAHGPETIHHAHYTGTCSIIANNFPQRFFNRLGATEVDPDSICNKAGQVALEYVYGSAVKGFDPRTARDAACILVWGANPSASGPHAHRYWLREAPGVTVVVDPVRHESAEAADLHLQPFPGSDAALAFALLQVIRREGLADLSFLDQRTVGWNELEPLLEGCTPDWGEMETGVPAALIEDAARLYGRGPSLLWLGQGLQRQTRGGNVMRACALLPAVTGNIGKPGAGIYYLNGKGATRDLDVGYVVGDHLRAGPAPTISHMDLTARLEDTAAAKALLLWNINIAASNPDQARLRRALGREDLFTVVVDPFATDSADLADIVLPAASFLEFDDLVASYFHLSVSAQVRASEPIGEALPNQEIFRRLARAMGYEEPELYEDDDAIIARLLAGAGLGLDFAGLAEHGTVPIPTPSGRIEIASARAEADGHPRLPQPIADPRPAKGRLRLLTPADKWLMNSSYGNDPGIGAKLGPRRVTLHPDDAAARDLVQGDSVTLRNQTGELVFALEISDAVPRGVALSHKSRWPKCEADGFNVNALNPGAKADMGESTAVHAVEVEVVRAG
jgi:anaerobic selenocysteine-containing dehydrogenase